MCYTHALVWSDFPQLPEPNECYEDRENALHPDEQLVEVLVNPPFENLPSPVFCFVLRHDLLLQRDRQIACPRHL